MPRPELNLIAAVSSNGVIGRKSTNALPWSMDYPEDMKHFRTMTAGGTVIMGSKTMDSIGRSLPKRRNVVISRAEDKYKVAETGIETFQSLKLAIDSCKEDEKVWIIGGGVIYSQAISLVKRLYITVIPETVVSDDPTDLITFPFLNTWDYEMTEKMPIDTSKQLFCYVYERDTWLEEPLTAEEAAIVGAAEGFPPVIV